MNATVEITKPQIDTDLFDKTPTFTTLKPRPGTKRTTHSVRADLATQAVEFAKLSGCTDEDAAKMTAIFFGDRALCAPMTAKIQIAHLNGVCIDNDILYNEVGGYLDIPLAGSEEETRCALRPDADQNIFLVGVERLGGVDPTKEDQNARFTSYSLVIPETEGDYPVVIGMNGVNDGQRVSLRWSRRLYQKPIRNHVTGETTWENKLETLTGLQNMEGVATQVALKAGFPLLETPVNANPPAQRGNRNSRNDRPAPTTTEVEGSDPWSMS